MPDGPLPLSLDDTLPRAEDFGFDPSDPAFAADPYRVLSLLRAAGPLVTYAPRGLYLLPRYADVHAALRDRRLGRAFDHRYTPAEFGQPEPDHRWPRWEESERWSLLNLEPPDHTRLRRLVTAVFTARSVSRLEPQIAALAAAHLDRVLQNSGSDGTFDLIADYAQPYSVAVICTLLGVPVVDGPRLLDWSHAIVKMYELHRTADQERAAEAAADEFLTYVSALLAERRARPADDLITALAQVADSGDRLTDDEILGTVIVLLNAGHEATVNTLGNGVRALMTHRDQWHRLTDGLVPASTAVEEMIRWDAPLQLFERWVLEDGVEIGGRRFAVGERIGMLFGSANRDPSRFPEPDAFLVDRGDATHIGFGGGLHFCIGAPLARLEIACSIDQLTRRCPGLQMVENPVYHASFVIHGLQALRLTPSSAGAVSA